MHTPRTPKELAASLQRLAQDGRSIILEGAGTKRAMGGPIDSEGEIVSTAALTRVLQYEPRDLTISVEAGLQWAELTRLLSRNRQMVPLDPPFAGGATVGGVVASNSSGPRRRLFGTARDLVIGLQFATLEGKLVQSGGMVVKNVAGLDMGKLMIGSFGTLAAIAVVNFKLLPAPEIERSFLLPFDTLGKAIAARAQILDSPLQPSAMDLLNPQSASTLGKASWLLAIRAGGNAAAVDRYERDLAALAPGVAFDDERQQILWRHIGDFTPGFLRGHPDGVVVRVSCTLKELEGVVASFDGPVVSRAGSGVCYGYFERPQDAEAWLAGSAGRGVNAVVEFSPEPWKRTAELWPAPGGDLELMRRVKNLFDPSDLLNRGRLYRRI